MQYGRPVIFFVVCFFMSLAVRAQVTVATEQQDGYLFRHLDYTNGLLSNEIFSLAQDKKGYMWIGTREGLQRYDGLRFVNYPDTAPSRSYNFITADICPADDGNRLLYNQSKGLKEWQLLSNRPSTLSATRELQEEKGQFYRDVKNDRWFLQTYVSGPKKFEGIAILKQPGKEPVFVNFSRDPQKRQTWVSMPNTYGVLVFDDSTYTVRSPEDPGNNALLQLLKPDPSIERKIFMDSHGNIWLVSWQSLLYRLHIPTGRLYTYSLSDILKQEGNLSRKEAWVTAMLEDDHGRIWIGTGYTGLLEYHPDEDNFSYVIHQTGNDLSIQYNYEILSLSQDREENIWVGTDKGINLFNPYRQYFTTLVHQKHYPAPVQESEINSILPVDHGQLLIGFWGNGINVYDEQMKLKNTLSFPDLQDKNLIWCFLRNEDGTTWAGCQHGFMHLIDAENRTATTIRPPELENSTIRCMARDSSGNILIGLHSGKIVVLDKQSGKFLPFSQQDPSIVLSPVANIFIDKGGRCWVAGFNGLYEFDPVRRCYKGMYKPYPWAPATCSGIAEYNDSLLVVGIGHAGIFLFNRERKIFSKLASGSGPALSAFAVRKDSAGDIWFTTDYDVCRYDPVEKKLQTYHPDRGLVNSSFVASHFLTMPSGKWLTWTNNEAVVFSPEEIGTSRLGVAKAMITGLKVFDRSLLIDSFLYARMPVRLSYTENFISIEYSGMQFSGVSQPDYYYRLTGVDKEWVFAGAGGYANYTGLAPGKYQFQVKTAGAGVKGDIASMDIIIVPPFWATGWFRILCMIVLVGILYLLIRWRVRRIQHDADIQQQIVTTEMMALRAQMNPHFIFNCINGIDALIQSDDKYHATIYLNKFAKLIRNILDSSKQNSIPLTKDLETLRLYIELEQFRNDHKFTAKITTDEEVARDDHKVPPLIIQPYVENAILHGLRNRGDNGGRLVISVTRQEGHLLYTIEDNGVGREALKKDARRRSYGMEMSSDRVKLFNRQAQAPVTVTDLQIDGRPAGTRVEVLLKIQ
jgi:ligand-binding sensor domain-containing protein/two-component sensor histidine kinase